MNQPIQQPQPMAPKQPAIAPWLLIVFIIVLLSGGGYLGYYFWNQSQAKTATPTTVATNTPSTSLTYTNGDYDFTLTLPSDWKGYQVKKDTTQTGVTAVYSIGVPLKDKTYYYAVSIFVYTPTQWQAVDKAVPSPTLLKQNAQYVFAFSGDNGAPSENPSNYAGISKLSLQGQSDVVGTFQFTPQNSFLLIE